MKVNNKNFFQLDRLARDVKQIAPYIYRNRKVISEFDCFEGNGDNKYPPQGAQWSSCSLNSSWKGRDRYIWLKFRVNQTLWDKDNMPVVYADFGTTDDCHNEGFESLCFIDNKPFQGVDQNHKEIILPKSYDNKEIEIYLKLWSGLEGGGPPREIPHTFKELFSAELDVKADRMYYMSKAVLETIYQLPEEDENRLELIESLDASLSKIDWTLRDDEGRFYESLHWAYNVLDNKLSELKKRSKVQISLIGHSHIDVAWLWRLKHTREKCARTFSTVLRYMELYPEYLYHQSQAQLYEFIKEDYPEIYQRIKEKVKEGRWEANGSMWVEADCNVTGGESLIRQILFGKRFFKAEFDVDCDVLWLPDVFGYSWALPQLLVKSGIKTFITSKISWNKYNKMPYDTFVWRGIDGSEVLTHFIITPDEPTHQRDWQSEFHSTYSGQITPMAVRKTWERYTNKDIYKGQIIPFGYGDGGGGVDRTMLMMYEAMKQLPGLPGIHQEKVSDFCSKLHAAFENTDKYKHIWDGELYLEMHRGTYTSQGFVKRENRKLEFKYRLAEILSVFSAVESRDLSIYEQDALNKGWKILLRNQFHDIIPGSSIAEVYEDARKEYSSAKRIADDVIQNSVKKLISEDESYIAIFNPSSFMRSDLVFAEMTGDLSFYDTEGNECEAVKTENGYIVRINDAPPLGYKNIRVAKGEAYGEEAVFAFDGSTADTPYYRVVFENGTINSIYDKENGRDVLSKPGNLLEVFEDRPLFFDAWDIDIFYNQKGHGMDELVSFSLKEKNNLRLVLSAEWKYRNSKISQDIIFYSHTRRIDFKTKLCWREHQQLLKVAFPVEVRAVKALYDIQFGNVERPTNWNTSWDMAKFEVVGHKWADMSEGDYGVALMNDCKYGYDIKDNNMRLTLVKSGIYPDPAADQGEHEFIYSLYPHKGSFKDSDVEQESLALNEIFRVFKGRAAAEISSIINPNSDNILIDAVKKAEEEEGIIVRLHEYKGCRSKVELTCGMDIDWWQEVQLTEEPVTGRMYSDLCFYVKPYEIKTILIKPKFSI